MFFSFDGLDGGGKSTQMELFCQWLRGLGREVVACRDPGSTLLGESLRQIVLADRDTPIAPRSEMLVYMAARAQLVEEVIRPALAAGRVVVSDRFLLANLVYQGHGRGLPLDDIRAVGRAAVAGVMPDATFVLDLPVEASLRRMRRPLDRMESAGRDFLERVRAGFLAESNEYPSPVFVVKAEGPIDAIQDEIRRHAATVLGLA